MKTIRKIIFAVILLELVAIIKINAQVPMQREVRCSTITKTYYSVTDNTIINNIPDFDLVQLVSDDLYKVEEYVINENQLSIIYTYPQLPRYENDYQYEVGKFIADMYGSTLYDHDNNILDQDLYDEVDNSFILSHQEVIEYGNYYKYFHINPFIAIAKFNQNGFITNYIGGVLIAVNDSSEIEINFNELTDEFRYYDNEDMLIFSKKTHYAMFEYIVYPTKEIEIHYDILPKSGTRYQIKNIKSYYYYTITSNGTVLIEIHNDIPEEAENVNNLNISQYQEIKKREIDLKTYPNPATNEVTLTLPFYMNENINIDIMSSLGKVLISKNNISGDEIKIDISSLKKGVYFIRCKRNDKTINTKFIKK